MWSNPGFVSNFIRWFFSILDSIGYFFLSGIFNIFFTVANANFFQGDVINEFYERVQLILGIFMIFILSFTLLQIIINPDMFKDKQKGAGSLVMRVAVMLVLLTLIVPINVPEDGNPLNEKINNNGILFGFLYQIQDTVVKDNVLGKLILGYNVADSEEDSGNLQLRGMESVGDVITAEIAHAFVTPALKDGYTEANADKESDNYYEKSALCPTDIKPSLNNQVTSGALLDHVNVTCKPEGGKEVYAFSYTGFGGVVCAIVMTIIIIGFTLDIAVRAIKLAILRLIAPIPIISYISPGQEKNGAFGNWVKTLTSTYLSLFIRLIIIYFGIYLIILLRNGDLVAGIKEATLANVFVIIGILVFMKEAPKFFQDMLGIKGDGKLFSGIGTMLGAAALTGGLAGSVVTGVRAGWQEGQEYRDGAGGKLSQFGRGFLTAGRAGLSGLAGGIGGAYAGGRAFMTSDKKVPGSVYSAMQKQMSRRAAHSTLFGRGFDKFSSAMTGMSPVDRMDAQIAGYNEASSLVQSIFSKADADSVWTNASGQTVKDLKERYELLQNADGVSERQLTDARNAYKNAQEQLVGDILSGNYTNGPFAEQMQIDLKNLRGIDRSQNLKLFGDVQNNLNSNKVGGAVKSFKALQFTAADAARNIKNTTKYNARKSNQQFSKQ